MPVLAADRPRRIALWGVLALITLWVHLAQFSATLQWDSHIFMVVAQQIRRGLLPYRDLWELKPPGTFYYLAAVFTVLPEALWSVRIADFAVYLVGAVCFYRICRTEVSIPIALIGTTAWIYFAHHPVFDVGGVYTEGYASICGIMAVLAAVTYARTGATGMAGLAGIAVSSAALFKHPGLSALAPAVIIMSRRPRIGAALLLWLGLALPIGLTVAYFWSHGALDDFLACNVWALETHGGLKKGVTQELIQERLMLLWAQVQKQILPFPFLVGALALGLPICLIRPSFLRWGMLAWVVLDFAGVAAQRNYYAHHFILTFPSTCLLGTLALGWLLQARPNEYRAITLSRAAVAILLLWLALPSAATGFIERQDVVRQQLAVLLSGPGAWKRGPARVFEEEVGGHIRQRTQPHDRIHVQGWGATALGIYWEAERRVSTRFFYEAPFPIDTRRELIELQENQPEYVVVVSTPPFLFMSDWLEAEYSLETLKWHDYPAKVYVRSKDRPFADGDAIALVHQPEVNSLALSETRPAGGGRLHPLPSPRRGSWTAPALRIQNDDGVVSVDWNPRNDLAYNRTGHGLASVEALSKDPDNLAKVLLGAATQRMRWSAWWRQETIPITVRLGFPAVIDHITLTAALTDKAEVECAPPEVASSLTADDPASFVPVIGTWNAPALGTRTLRFAPQRAAAVRVLGTPASCDFGYGINRVRVGAAGMGIQVRYRAGERPDLSEVPWQDVDPNATELKVPGARFIQMQFELWSDYADIGPLLHHVQIGRVRYSPGPAALATTH